VLVYIDYLRGFVRCKLAVSAAAISNCRSPVREITRRRHDRIFICDINRIIDGQIHSRYYFMTCRRVWLILLALSLFTAVSACGAKPAVASQQRHNDAIHRGDILAYANTEANRYALKAGMKLSGESLKYVSPQNLNHASGSSRRRFLFLLPNV